MPFPQSGIVRPLAAILAVLALLLAPRNAETQPTPSPDADSSALTLGMVYEAVDRAKSLGYRCLWVPTSCEMASAICGA